MRHFIEGLQEADGTVYRDDEGIPACAGTGICKEDTVRDALDYLRKNKFITIFPGKRGTVTAANVYLPLAEELLAPMALCGGVGVLPEHLTQFYTGEHVWFEGGVGRVTSVEIGALAIRPVNRRNDFTGPCIYVPNENVERIRIDEWKNFKNGDEATDHARSV